MKRLRLQDWPLRQKLIWISLLAAGAALLLSSIGVGIYEYQIARDTAVGRLRTMAQVAAVNSTAALTFRHREDAQKNLAALGTQREISWACFYDSAGALFAGFSRQDASTACPERSAAEAGHEFDGNHVTLTHPIQYENQRIGTLVICSDLLDLRGRLISYLRILPLVIFASGLVALLLASRLQRVISVPILKLVAASRRVSFERDYSLRAEKGGRDELGMLIDAFNEMLEQIQARDWKLECARAELDDDVKERTRELQDAVTELRSEILQRKRAEKRIRFLADYDALTGLPNRRLLEQRLERAIQASSQTQRPAALLFLDLDRFKEINDGYGHTTGDLLLREVSERLDLCVRDSDQVSRPEEALLEEEDEDATVSRQGGDEFTILLSNLHSAHDATRVARRILDSFREPFHIGDLHLVVGTSIGIAIHPDDGGDPETLIKHADTAMYHAKSVGGNDFQYFTSAMKAAAVEKLTLELDLREAISRDQLFLVYQPLLDLNKGGVPGVEALLRWRHPEQGIVAPPDFIRLAEESGLIVEIGEWVLNEACRACARWSDEGLPPMRVSVNVSSRQLRPGAFVDSVTEALESSGLPPGQLQLEVTESMMVQNEQEAVEILRALRNRGVEVALDDFGTGYSSLSYLRRLPLDALKIDRSFVTELGSEMQSESIVSAVIRMAQALGLRVVAEGVETEEQLARLRDRGCDEVQGFLISTPVEADELEAVIRRIRRG